MAIELQGAGVCTDCGSIALCVNCRPELPGDAVREIASAAMWTVVGHLASWAKRRKILDEQSLKEGKWFREVLADITQEANMWMKRWEREKNDADLYAKTAMTENAKLVKRVARLEGALRDIREKPLWGVEQRCAAALEER